VYGRAFALVGAVSILPRRSGGDLVIKALSLHPHPIYTAACVFCWAGVLANFALVPFAAGVLLLIGAVIRVFAEERLLMDRYPGIETMPRARSGWCPISFSAFICFYLLGVKPTKLSPKHDRGE